MGKASSQKKKRRQGIGTSRSELEAQRALQHLAGVAHKLSGAFTARKEHRAAINRTWWRGAEPEAAEVPTWAEGSAGNLFFGASQMTEWAVAPRLAMAEIPAAEVVAGDSGQWGVAVAALVRAVVLDRVPVTDPLVTRVIELLGPAVDAEFEYAESWDPGGQFTGAEEEDFPEDDAPLFLLGGCALVDATWAVMGLDRLSDVMDRLVPLLDDVVAGLTCTPKPTGKEMAVALIRAAAAHYRFDEEPADAQTLRELGGQSVGNSLEFLTSKKVIEPSDALIVGLTVLAALADLCRTSEASALSSLALGVQVSQDG